MRYSDDMLGRLRLVGAIADFGWRASNIVRGTARKRITMPG